MNVIAVPDDYKLSEKVKEGGIVWDGVRDHMVTFQSLLVTLFGSPTSISFSGQETDDDMEEAEDEDDENEEGSGMDSEIDVGAYDNVAPVPTVWIGVLPRSITATAAMQVSKGIRVYLNELDAGKIDIALHEMKFNFSAGSALCAPVEGSHALESDIADVSAHIGTLLDTAKSTTGNQDSLELPIFNHEEEPGTFSKGGDSGSLIVDILGGFVALLTGGTNKGTDGSYITYSTPFKWVWELVCAEFPGVVLCFDDLEAFNLAASD
ncbi:hypothetical protein BDY19DRAFT_994071 [Irpex rosettiformis]|uniref:Uncharacterized protein n=1 Tax=Irpex rosettiformis TaxID=378272 RepID=A0ACB8U2Z7_9APHY|nr:hypothetical protein BDY19DRAFT_994071 [Irpex rosettiformis]